MKQHHKINIGVFRPSPAGFHPGSRIRVGYMILLSGLLFFPLQTLTARTIELSGEVIDKMAVLSEEGPMQSWAAREVSAGIFLNDRLDLDNTRSVLIRYNLDVIPPRQRIAHAEWVIPIERRRPTTGARLFVWRMLADWGAGVGHSYRRTVPDAPIQWALPGARGNSSDRATRPTSIVQPTDDDEQVVTVTEDVELWYSGVAPNRGWMIAVEDPEVEIWMPIPLNRDPYQWILRITYEPIR